MKLPIYFCCGCAILMTASLRAETLLVAVPSETTNALSLPAIVSEVLSNNPALKATRANWEAMLEREPQARAWEDPKFQMDATAGRFVSVPANSFADQRFALEQSLPLSGKNRLRGKAAGAEATAALEQFHRAELDAVRNARVAYFQLANAWSQLDVNRRNVDLLRQFAEFSRDKFKTANRSQADVLNAETTLARLEEDQADIHQQISRAEIELNRLRNRPPQSPVSRPPELKFQPLNLSLQKLLAREFSHRPVLAIALAKIDAARARLNAAHKEWVPDPALRVEADRYNESSQAISEVDAGFSVSLPWFNRGKYKAAIRENQKLLESAEQESAAARENTLSLVQNQFVEVETFHHHTELYQSRLLPLAQQTVDAKLAGYRTDKDNLLDLLTAQQTAREVEAMYWDHLMHYQIALAELEALVGANLDAATTTAPEHHHDSK